MYLGYILNFTFLPSSLGFTFRNSHFKVSAGPPCGPKCVECDNVFHVCIRTLLLEYNRFEPRIQVGGPVWLGPLHSTKFIESVLETSKGMQTPLHTQDRIDGMLTVAKEVSN